MNSNIRNLITMITTELEKHGKDISLPELRYLEGTDYKNLKKIYESALKGSKFGTVSVDDWVKKQLELRKQ